MFNSNGLSLSDIAAVTGRNNNGDGFADGNGWWVLIILFALFGGWGNNGWGANRSNGNGAVDGYVLASDFSNIERKIDGVNNGICDGFYAVNTGMLNGFANVQSALCQGFSGVNANITNLGYQNQLAAQGINTAIQANTTQGLINTNTLQQQIQQCCCENEKLNMQSQFAAQQYNCNTMQAIDKLGDRIIDYMSNQQTQNLRDENFALKLAASQQAQNNYLVNQFAICGLRLRRVMAKLIMLFILSAILPRSIIIVELRLVSGGTLLGLLYAVKTCQNIILKLTLS